MTWQYPALMGCAIATGVLVSRRTQRSLPLTGWQRFGIGFGAFCGGMIGAKLPYVLIDPEGLASGLAWFESGKTILMGLVGGYLGVEAAKWALDIQVKTGDGFAAPVSAAVAVGRLACFVGPCCYGKETELPWGVDFGDGLRRHPTQIYEFFFHAAMAIVLLRWQQRGHFRGQLIKIYILSYLAYRFATEFIRHGTPSEMGPWGLTVYQWTALACAPLFSALLWKDRESNRGSATRNATTSPRA